MYFFDIAKSVHGKFYLKISERKILEGGFRRDQIMVFEENIKCFVGALDNAVKKLNTFVSSEDEEQASRDHAYLIWRKQDDDRLEFLFREGKKISELAQIFGRTHGAIRSRIKKLELTDKPKT